MSARSVQKRLETRAKKTIQPHMWVLFKIPTGGYGVSIGDPRSTSSKLRAVLPNRRELEDWIRSNVGHTVSADHVIDTTGLRLVAAEFSDFYRQVHGL